jgi:transposase InsO family protein
MPVELQERVHQEVQEAKRRSGWAVRRTLDALGVSPASYYRWRREAGRRADGGSSRPLPPLQLYEALPEEKATVKAYALKHPELRHRELAWKMVDEDVAYLSPSTTYRILRAEKLVCPWNRRKKRSRPEEEKAQRPDQIWATDLRYVPVGKRNYYLISFVDEYSRYITHWELLSSMDGQSVSLEAQAALETLPRDLKGKLTAKPEIRSDNGSGYVSKEFAGVLAEHEVTHRPIKPHCPEENGLCERLQRTLGEALEEEELTDYYQTRDVIARVVRWYNERRLHSALGFLRPIDYYRGNPTELYEARRKKLAAARHQRREKNLKLRQPTLPLESQETVANEEPRLSHSG